MNRREILKSFGATAALATLPIPVSAGATTRAAPKLFAGIHAYQNWAVQTATMLGDVSAPALQKALGLTETQAMDAFTSLIKRGAISMPNAAGVSRAVGAPPQPNFVRPKLKKPKVDLKKIDRNLDADEDIQTDELEPDATTSSEPLNEDLTQTPQVD